MRCLLIDELLINVLEEVKRAEGGHGDLAAAARVCSWISKTALDVLWHSQTSVMPLWKTLGGAVEEINGGEQRHGREDDKTRPQRRLKLISAITDARWRRLTSYGERIRILHIPYEEGRADIPYPFSTVDLLTVAHNGHDLPVTKRLLELNMRGGSTQVLTAPLYLATTLRKMELPMGRTGSSAAGERTLLGNIVRKYHELTKLSISGLGLDLDDCEALAAREGRLDLACGHVSGEGWQRLSKSRGLRVLRMSCWEFGQTSFGNEVKVWGGQRATDERYFAGLEELSARCTRIADATAMLEGGELRRLKKLVVYRGERAHKADREACNGFFEAVGKSCKVDALECVMVGQNCRPWRVKKTGSLEGVGVGLSTMGPLLSFERMRILWVDLGAVYDLDDADLERMARAWPRMESLAIGGDFGWKNKSRVTLRGLRSLAKHCVELKDLSLRVDATIRPEYQLNEDDVTSNYNVIGLTLGNSPIHDEPQEVAKELCKIMPRLISIMSWYDCDGWDTLGVRMDNTEDDEIKTYYNGWQRVEEAIVSGELWTPEQRAHLGR
ncbi:hypothetical protein PLICRDRAFT_33126 [Plicaturopsis crispa FD-325 SS-3]|uniref:F-box domain-containing protein n=1 Tax=Plicaturopsis crispa FD-325 SS-3 TaxID=944288 RepID=A0A0C9SPU8_PLICR|nr:hypothetical protein PLICRDRAFT_33126 [Plicaturopsis crispa FD-325 SS-3]